jgi:TPR repeat protein
LISHISTPGLEIGQFFRRVRRDVRKSTNGKQIPWVSSSLENDFFFRMPGARGGTVPTPPSTSIDTLGMTPPTVVAEKALWRSIERTTNAQDIRTFLDAYPDGANAGRAKARLAALEGSGNAVAAAEVSPVRTDARVFEPLIGIGSVLLGLPAPTDAQGRSRAVTVEDVPDNGVLSLDGGDRVWPDMTLEPADIARLTFDPAKDSIGLEQEIVLRADTPDTGDERIVIKVAPWIHACDMLAGFPHDPFRVTAGVRPLLMKTDSAIAACRLAVTEYPNVGRFTANLARAYRLAGQYEMAVEYSRKAIKQEYPAALANLGVLYRDGRGVERDYARAIELFRAGSQRGDSLAYTSLGRMFLDGLGVEKDYGEALRWFYRAAEDNADWGFTLIGMAFENGHGVEKSAKEAVYWYGRAAALGDPSAKGALGQLYRDGAEGVPRDLKKAVKWFRSGAGQGVPFIQTELGRLFEKGLGVEKSVNKAIGWYRRAAKAGHPVAYRELGRLYENGTGVEKDPIRARELYREAFERGDFWGARHLGRVHEKGIGGPVDEAGALTWYLEAAKHTNWADRTIAKIYLRGGNIPAEPIKAVFWFERAAKAGDPWAARDLARLYDKGQGVKKDPMNAVRWYAKAFSLGATDAKVQELTAARLRQMPSKALIAFAEESLKAIGYDPGAVDGVADERTRIAILRYQADAGFDRVDDQVTVPLIVDLAGRQ